MPLLLVEIMQECLLGITRYLISLSFVCALWYQFSLSSSWGAENVVASIRTKVRHSSTEDSHKNWIWQKKNEAYPEQVTMVWEWENTTVMALQFGHFTSMKYELGLWTNLFSLCFFSSSIGSTFSKSISISVLYYLLNK